MIRTQSYSVNNNLLTNQVLGIYINNFWNDVFAPLIASSEKHLMLMCKVEFNDEGMGYRTLGDLRRVNFNDKDLFIEYLSARLGLLNDSYFTNPICKITFTYIIKNGLATDERRLLQDLTPRSKTTHRFNNLNLPMSMNPSDFGNIIVDNYIQLGGESIHRIIIDGGNKNFQFDINSDETVNKVTVLGPSGLTWIDTKINEELFQREIGKSIIFFLGGEKVLIKKQLNAKPISTQAVDAELNNNFITMDTETKNVQGKIIPYLICAYNGKDYVTSYANENLDQKVLFTSFINQLVTFFTKESNNILVYAHNLSGFDGVFLLKQLLELGKVTPLIHNGKIITIRVKLNIAGYIGKTIIFKDSYLLLPQSLRSLCAAFNIAIPKGHFPYLLNDIFYKGVIPRLELWSGLELPEYIKILSKYSNLEWNFKDEAIKYCKLDCSSLHEIISIFNQLIFNEFKINVDRILTLPGLAMKIYRSNFMPKDTIFSINSKLVEQDIRESYTGGAVDVYIPSSRISPFFSKIKAVFRKLFCYDVNSLYPFIMASTMMPVGRPVAFNGDIRSIDPNAYGFFYCKITSPEFIELPILQRSVKTSDGLRTIAGLGTWTGWIYSPEMDNATKYGYTFEILKGYEFNKANIFESYVNKMYNLRLLYPRGNAMNLIAKLLMNSLYGKFGMKLDSTKIEIFNSTNETELQTFNELLETQGITIKDFVQIGNHILTIRNNLIDFKYIEDEDMFHGIDVNIAISSAITAGGRLWMSTLKMLQKEFNFKIYYTDTDSVYTDKPLPADMIGTELGKFKLEYVIDKAVFLAPKVYGLILDDGTEIIKIKGVKKELLENIHFNDLNNLLIKDSVKEFNQQKWYKELLLGEISVIDTAYSLKVTSNKRKAGYITQDGIEIFHSTKPYNYDEIIIK